MIKANPKVKEFRTRPLQFEDKLDALFLGNSASGVNSWIPTGNTPPPFDSSSMGSALHGVDWETETAGETGDSLNSEENAVVSEIKSFHKKRRAAQANEGASSRSRTGFKSELKEIMTSLQDMAKSVGNSNQGSSPSQKAIEDAVDALNQLEGVEMGSLFYYSAAAVLSEPTPIRVLHS